MLADQIVTFGRVLRRAGLEIGPGQMLDALQAVEAVGVRRRDDVYHALRGVLVTDHGQLALFDDAFALFWRAPEADLGRMQQMLPRADGPPPTAKQPRQRVQDALRPPSPPPPTRPSGETEIDLVLTYSDREAFRQKDFADFTADEVAAAKAFLRRLHWPIAPHATRRSSPRTRGHLLDVRRTVRQALRHHGEILHLHTRGRTLKPRPVVVLCDISGSMERYARLLLHFVHSLTAGLQRVESFVFGTHLTRITRAVERRDVDQAVAEVTAQVNDWSGGTRIGEAIKAFNYTWLRRVLRSDGVVLVISDGWDRGDPDLLDREMDRLHRSCHRLIWLNPLLGYADYQPLTRGIQAALPHVDDFLPVHNLVSLEQLGLLLARLNDRR